VKGIQVCSNKGPGLLLRRDNYKNVKMGWSHLKIFFSRTTGPILTRLGINHRWEEGIQVCSNEGDCRSPRGDNSETQNSKNTLKIFKNLLLQNQLPKFNQTWYTLSLIE
jgi:hypothetical protein